MWPKAVLRAIAIANVLLVLISVFNLHVALTGFSILENGISSSPTRTDFPYTTAVFYALVVVNTTFLLAFLASSYQLWFLRTFGRTLTNTVLCGEIGYLLSCYLVKLGLAQWGGEKAQLLRNSIAAVYPLANFSGLSAQLEVVYFSLALLLLNLGYSHLDCRQGTIAPTQGQVGFN